MSADPAEVPAGSPAAATELPLAGQLRDLCQSVRSEVHEELQDFLRELAGRIAQERRQANGRNVVGNPTRPSVLSAATVRGAAAQLPPMLEDPGDDEWCFHHMRRFSLVGEAAPGSIYARDAAASALGPSALRPSARPRMASKPSWTSLGGVSMASGQEGDHSTPSKNFATASTPASARSNSGTSEVLQTGSGSDNQSSSSRNGQTDKASTARSTLGSRVTSRMVHSTRMLMGPWKDDVRFSTHQSIHAKLLHYVQSATFDTLMCSLILVNALAIGLQTNYAATNMTTETPAIFGVVEQIFCVIFTGELVLRVYSFRIRFVYGSDWHWNLFDTIVVGLQLMEIVMGDLLPNLSFMRVLRILRLVRAIRLIRILHHISELRRLVASIASSMSSLCWTLVLLMLLIYTVSLFITQFVSDHRLSHPAEEEHGDFESLDQYFGTLYRTMLTFFQAVTGGVDWDNVVVPLMEKISDIFAPFICAYIAFTVLAMLNVVTAVFVEAVLERTKKDKDHFVLNNVRELFQGVDGGIQNGILDWEAFYAKLDSRPMLEFFRAIDVDPSEAPGLFRLLDMDNGGTVDAEEFLTGCLRLRGPARALDVAILLRQVAKISQHLMKSPLSTQVV